MNRRRGKTIVGWIGLLIGLTVTGCLSSATFEPDAPAAETQIASPADSTPATPTLSSPAVPVVALESDDADAEIGPGRLVVTKGKPLRNDDTVAFVVFDTHLGLLTIGCLPQLQPKLAKILLDDPGRYVGAKLSFSGDDFVKVVPSKPVAVDDSELSPHVVAPGAGLAYANPQGTILVALNAASPPHGYQIIGQAKVSRKTLKDWKASKEAISVATAGPLRT